MRLFFLIIILGFSIDIIGQHNYYGRYDVLNPKCKSPKSILIHDNFINKDFIFKLNPGNVDFNYFSKGDFSNNKLFVVFQKNNNVKNKYNQELWYFTKDSSRIVMLGDDMDFLTSANNRYIAIIDNKTNSTTEYEVTASLKLFDLATRRIIKNQYIQTNKDLAIQPYGWSSGDSLIWLFASAVYCTSQTVWVYNIKSDSFNQYSLPINGCSAYDINLDKQLILYSDSVYAPGFDENPPPPNNTGKIKLYMLNFKTNEDKFIKQNIGIDFNPKFLNNDIIEYYDSDLKKRVKVKFN